MPRPPRSGTPTERGTRPRQCDRRGCGAIEGSIRRKARLCARAARIDARAARRRDAYRAPGAYVREGIQAAYYPVVGLLSHAVGQVDPDDNGVSGLASGSTRSCAGTTLRWSCPSICGCQHVLEHEMNETLRAFSAKAAGGIVMDVRSGEILALTSLPNYEPNSRILMASGTRYATG